jgi:hypothetical protein
MRWGAVDGLGLRRIRTLMRQLTSVYDVCIIILARDDERAMESQALLRN